MRLASVRFLSAATLSFVVLGAPAGCAVGGEDNGGDLTGKKDGGVDGGDAATKDTGATGADTGIGKDTGTTPDTGTDTNPDGTYTGDPSVTPGDTGTGTGTGDTGTGTDVWP